MQSIARQRRSTRRSSASRPMSRRPPRIRADRRCDGCTGRREAGASGCWSSIDARGRSAGMHADVRIDGDPELQLGGAAGAVSPDGVRARSGRGGGRRSRPERTAVIAATSSGTATCSCCRSWPPPIRRARGRSSSTASGACPRPGPRARAAGRAGGALRVGVGRRRRGRDAAQPRATAPGARSRSTPASARSTSSPTSPGRPAATSTGPATRHFARGPGQAAARRDRALLGVADRTRRRRARAHPWRDRPGRVPRAGRRQRASRT